MNGGPNVSGGDADTVRSLAEVLSHAKGVQWADSAVVVWGTRESLDPDQLTNALDQGVAAFRRLVATEKQRQQLRAVVNVVVSVDDVLGNTLTSAVAGLGRSWARELARYGTTVNTVAYSGPSGIEDAADAAQFLAHSDAAWITGQSLGVAGARLAAPERKNPSRFRGKVLVSGGAGHIGTAIVRKLFAEGHDLIIGYARSGPANDLADSLDPSGRRCGTVPLDMTNPDQIAAAANVAIQRDVSGVVICGGWNATKRVWDIDPVELRRTWEINLLGPLRLLEHLAGVIEDRRGRVVGITSESGRIGDAGRSIYGGAKAGLARYVGHRHLQSRTASYCSVSPGPIDSPLMRATHGDPDAAEIGIEKLRRLVPLRRLGRPEEIAHAVSVAFADHGSFLGGEILSVSGGTSMC